MIGAVAAALGLLAAAACSGPSPKAPIGTLVDSGFRPSPNGFPFENYGNTLANGSAPTNLTAADVRTMFGDRVCADARSGKCDLIPEAQAWLDTTNQEMDGGHCYGFSVAAELLWQGSLNADRFGAPSPPGLAIDNNEPLQRLLAYDWALQLLDSVQSHRTNGSPNQILGKLRNVLTAHPKETYTVVIWKRDGTGGHAVTPYAVDNKGGGMFDVKIYDNNYPDVTRTISFDTNRNTWYYQAATVPTQPDSIYQGDSVTKSISLYPTSPGLGTQPCPFCGKVPAKPSSSGGAGASNTEEIYLLGSDTNRGNLVVSDHAGHRLGDVNGTLIDQIPGASFDPVVSDPTWTNKITPDFFVPANGTYTISLDGTGLTGADTETVGIIGPSFDLSVGNIQMHPGETDTLVAAPDATKLTYKSSQAESPTLHLGVSDRQADYAFVISGVSDQPGSAISLSLPAESGNLTVANGASGSTSNVDIGMTRYTEQGTKVFKHSGIPLAGGDTAELQFGNWTDASQSIPLVTTRNGQRSTVALGDQAAGSVVAPGSAGASGPAGPAGTTGPAGAGGAPGPAGGTGAAGAQGPSGATGATGPPGAQGPAGPTGPAGRTGAQGPAGITNAWQGALVGGAVLVGPQPTLVVRTPSLPVGHFEVTADITVAGSGSLGAGDSRGALEIDCWVTPNSAGIASNRDGVRIATDIGTPTQSLSLNDLLTTSASSDEVDLVCSTSAMGNTGTKLATVTHASIIATGISSTATATETVPSNS